MSIIDLDAMKAAGEIPSDLDRRVMKILGLSEMCNGVPSFPSWRCAQCDLHLPSWNSSSTPHRRVAKPYSKTLVASRDVLEWLPNDFTAEFNHRGESHILTLGEPRRDADHVIVLFSLSDEALALAVAVNALFGEKE